MEVLRTFLDGKMKIKGKREIPFVKMQGIGNDYIYIDTLHGETPDYLEESKIPDLSRKISDRHFGVGTDGLILILPSDHADFRMRIFNADGSEAKMCGNGVRCVAKYVKDLGFTDKDVITVQTESGIKTLRLFSDENGVKEVEVDMGAPYFKRREIPVAGPSDETMDDQVLKADDKEFKVTGIGMGNPHGVVYFEDVDSLDLPKIGPQLENSPVWPDRANIEFVQIISPSEIKIRVWERGSGETWACGTGACAAAVASYTKGKTNPDVTVNLRGGKLRIKYDPVANKVFMTGGAEFVAQGKFLLSNA